MSSEKESNSPEKEEQEFPTVHESTNVRAEQEQNKYVKKIIDFPVKPDISEEEKDSKEGIIKKLVDTIALYHAILGEGNLEQGKQFHFSGNLSLINNHQDAAFIQNMMLVKAKERGFSAFMIDAENLVNTAEPVDLYHDVIETISLQAPALVFMNKADPVLAKKPDESMGKHAKKIAKEMRRFLVEKKFRYDKIVFVSMIDDIADIDPRMVNTFDFSFVIDQPTKKEREIYLHHLFPENAATSFSIVAKEMDGWTWNDIKAFAKQVVLHVHKTNAKEIGLNSFMDLIRADDGTDRFVPPSVVFSPRRAIERLYAAPTSGPLKPSSTDDTRPNPKNVVVLEPMEDNCNPFKEQLFQKAASNDYEIVMKIIERLEKQVILPSDKPFFLKYPFLLQEEASILKQKLDAAKQRIEMLKQNFKR